jgi:erythronate-4-phosphate dehydrogenase
MSMKIIVDENIPFGNELFGSLGEVTLISGRNITHDTLQDASALIVRSITRVNEALLKGTNIQFVGSTTTGTDHIELDYLKQEGIGFSAAIGANANSVAEYVLTAILTESHRRNLSIHETTLGIVGVGNIGTLVAQKAKGLGMTIFLNDPPRGIATKDPNFLPLEALLETDFLTLHVPLTFEGPHATFHLFGEEILAKFSSHTTLLNTSRGAVVDNQDLLKAIKKKSLPPPILDVWEHEPNISWDLLSHVAVGTPHIAGHSFDGKIQGAQQVYQAVCDFFQTPPVLAPIPEHQIEDHRCIFIDAEGKDLEEIFYELVTQAYSLHVDHAHLKNLLQHAEENRPHDFDQLRKHYPRRREFHTQKVVVTNGTSHLTNQIKCLGFSIH